MRDLISFTTESAALHGLNVDHCGLTECGGWVSVDLSASGKKHNIKYNVRMFDRTRSDVDLSWIVERDIAKAAREIYNI